MAEHVRLSSPRRSFRTLVTRSLIPIASALAALAPVREAHATHAMGGDLTYQCLGGNQYKIILNFYRDCNGIAAPTNCNNGLQFHVASPTCNPGGFDQCFALESVQVITPICATELDRCLNSGGTYGIEKYTFSKVIDLSAWAGCGSDWAISWGLCCRNNAITSLQNPGNQQLYLDTRLNNTFTPCNSSPVFLTNPTPFYCLGQSVSYNPGAFDPDGDSLDFALIPARGANGANLNYANGYSALQPVHNAGGAGSVQLDPVTGTMTVVPDIQQVAVVTYRVREYRNGVQIGVITRDVQVVVRTCPGNTAPTASGINGTNTYNVSVCAGNTLNFTVNSSDPNAGQSVTMTWNNGIPSASFVVAGTPFPTGTFTWTPTPQQVGTHLFTVTVVDNSCPLVGTNAFGFTVQVTPPLTPANAGPDQSVCGTSATLAGVLPFPNLQGTWSVVSGSGTFSNPNSATATVSGLSPGQNIYQWSVNYQTCGVTTDQVVVTSYDPGQAAANAGPDQSLCLPTNSATLAGNTATAPAVGTWTLVTGQGTITNPNSANSTVTGLGVGANTFRWTIINGPCGAPTTDQVTIFLYSNLQGVANAGPDQQLCAPNQSTTLTGNPLIAPATGQWTVVQGSGTFGNANAPTTTVSGLAIGVNIFRWTVNNGPCTPSSTTDDVAVTVFDPNSPNANAGPDVSICSPPNNVTLTGSTPTAPATGVWTLVSGSGTIVTPNSPSTQVTGLGLGGNVFRWTVNNGPCANGSTNDQVTVTVYDSSSPAANAGPDQSICSTTPSAMLAGNAPIAPATGQWTLVSGTGTITNPTSPSTTVTALGVGNNVFQWTLDNGPCPSGVTNDQVTITVFDANAVTANAGPDQSLCTPTTSTALAGNTPTFPSTGSWTLVSGSGTIVTPGSPTSQVTGLGVGANVFRWTVTNGPCTNPVSTDQVTIFLYDGNNPVANAGPDQQLCGVTNTMMAGSALTFPATGTWTLVSGSGTIANPASPTSQITGLAVGANVFQWTVNNGPCGAPTSDQVTVFVFDPSVPTANAGPDQQLCTPMTSTTLTGSNIIFPASGTWTLVSGSGTIATPNASITVVSGLAVGVNVFQWAVSNGPCAAPSSDQVTITVFDQNNPVANAGPDQSICVPTVPNTVNLQGSNVISPATGTWTLVSGTGTIVSPNSPTTQVTNLTVGVNIFQWTVSNGPCTPQQTTDQVAIYVFDAANPLANAGQDQDLCTPITSTILNGSLLTVPATGTWTLVGGSGTIVSPNTPTTQVTGLGLGANVFQWTVSNGTCADPLTSDQVTINVFNGNAQEADAGPDQTICSTTASITMAGNVPTGLATGQWSVVQGTASFANAASATTSVSGLSVGTNILQWTIDNGACGLSSDQMTVIVYDDAQASADAGPDQSICVPTMPSQVNLAGNAIAFPATGLWTLVSGTGTIADPNDPNTLVTGLSVGENVFQWSVDNGPCANGSTSDQVSIFVFDAANGVANAGPDQELCTPANSTTLAGSTPTFPATGQWTLISGTASITDPSDPATTVTGLIIGQVVLRWTVNNGPCANPVTTDDMTISIYDENNPVANAGPDQELCILTTQTVLNGSPVTFPAVGTWTVVSGSGAVSDPNSPFTTLSGYSVGDNIYTWTVDNGPCANGLTVDTIHVFVYDSNNPSANAGPDQQLCTPQSGTTLAGSSVTYPAVGTWTLVSGNGTITDLNDPATTITGLSIGVNVFEWTVDNGPCTNGITHDQVTIEVFDSNNPVAGAGPDQELCTPNTSTTMAGSLVTVPAVGTWTLVSGSGTIVDPNDPNTAITGLAVGENVFQWSVSNGPCANPLTTDQVSIFVFDANNPVADAGPDRSQCTPNVSANMAGSALTFPATGEWTLVSGSGTITDPSDPNTTITDLGIGENVFQWTVSNGPCANGLTSDQLSIFIYDANNANANAGPDQSLCTPNTSTSMVGSAVTFPATGTWTLVSGNGTIVDPNDPNTGITGLAVGENIFQWTVDNGPCANGTTSDQVSIFIYDANNANADAGADQSICTPASTVVMAGSAVTFPAIGTWTLVSGSATITDPNDPNTVISDLTVGEVVLQWTVDNGPCANGTTSDQMAILIYDEDNAMADAGSDQELCTPQSSTGLSGSPVIFPAVGTWSVLQGAGTFADPNDPNTTVNGLAVGENILLWTVDNGPCANGTTTDTVSIFLFDQGTPAADAGPDQELCTPQVGTLMAGSTVIFPAVGTWTVISGTAVVADVHDPNTPIDDLTVGESILVWTVENGPCNDPITTDTVRIALFDSNMPSADAGPDQQVCTPVTSATLAGSPITFPATGEWILVQGQGTITDPNDPNTTVTGLGVGENIFTWVVNNSHCGSGLTSDDVSIFLFDLNAPPADAGPDQELCFPDQQTVLAGNTPTPPAIGVWSVTQGPASVGAVNDPASLVEGLTVGEVILTWTIDNGICGVSSDDMHIQIFDPTQPPADAGQDQELCTPADSTFLDATTPIFPAHGTWSLVQGAGFIFDANDPATQVSGLAIGDNVFQWTVYNGPCNYVDSVAFVTITLFDDSTAAANAGPDQEVCLPLTSTTMAADIPQPPASGTWTLLGGSGTIADPSDPLTDISDLQVGISTFIWTLDNGPCANNGLLTDTMTIYVYDPSAPSADAGPDQELCTPQDSTVMAANTPLFPGVGTWTLVGGTGTIADVNDPTSTVTGMSVGDNLFVWTIYNGQCGFGPPSTDTVTVTVFDENQPSAAAGPDQQLCTPTSGAVLQGNDAIYPATGLWTVVQGGATLADPADPSTAAFNITVGENIFVWTIFNGPCPNAVTTDTVSVFLFDNNAPAADAGPDRSICVPTFPNEVTMDANVPLFPAIGTWTLVSGNGMIADIHDAHTLITGLTVGEHVFQWAIANGPCPNGQTTDEVTILVYDAAQPDADAGPDQQLCTPDNSVQLAGNGVIFPATGIWTIAGGSGTIADPTSPTSTVTGLTVGETMLVWTIDNGPCANGITVDTMVVQVFDDQAAAALAGDDQSFCSPVPSTTMFASSPVFPAIGTWMLISGSGTIAAPNDPFTTITDLDIGENVFQWVIANGPCGSSNDDMSIFVYDGSLPDADAGDDQEFCQHEFTSTYLDGTPVSGLATASWSVASGSATFGGAGDPGTQVTGLALGDNLLVWTVNNGVCGNSADTMLIHLEDCLTLVIPDAFSPNHDGVNDTYVIHNLEYYPAASLVVFNRWGAKVLDRSPYNNDWDGRSENSLNWGEELPESTYYYVLDLGDGSDAYTGYIYIRR
ncbi:MAG: gliding motility-associated C-terminal domain-containing protein [Flavobacteriales bacterium]|nr:gliding motility-associated C-terminal domain-containing protein [Flavobacteriales bacterium]